MPQEMMPALLPRSMEEAVTLSLPGPPIWKPGDKFCASLTEFRLWAYRLPSAEGETKLTVVVAK